MNIEYSDDREITVDQFIDVLRRSTLSERRPVDDIARISSMVTHANLICAAWHGDRLVGVSRSLTDFDFCCYLADLAVDLAYQSKGIGKNLIRITQKRLHPQCKIILLAAPKAENYYPKVGFSAHHSAWLIAAGHAVD